MSHHLTARLVFDSEGDIEYGSLKESFECTEPKGSDCRTGCSNSDCETWWRETVGDSEVCGNCKAPLQELTYCNALEWITAGDLWDAFDGSLRNGRHEITTEWTGDGFIWHYTNPTNWRDRFVIWTRKKLWRIIEDSQ